MSVRAAVIAVLLGCAAWSVAGCDGKGLVFGDTKTSGGDQPPDNSDGGSDGGGGTPTPDDKRFAGVWAAAFGDDVATIDASTGRIQYVMRIILTQQGGTISGTGRVIRVFSEGSVSNDTQPVTFRVTGNANLDDAQLKFKTGTSGPFDFEPTWYLRLAGSSRMVGMYEALNVDGDVVRSGTGVWYSVASASLDAAWVAAFTDNVPGGAALRKDRVAELTLTRSSNNALGGAGNLYTERENDTILIQGFSVTRGLVSGPELGFTFGAEDLATTPMDWFGVFDGNRIVAAYAQFNVVNELASAGAATWYRAPSTGPSSVSHTWVAAFSDTSVAGLANPRRDFLAVMDLAAQTGGAITGTAQVLDESALKPSYRTYDVANAAIVGTQVRLELRDRSGGGWFTWDLQVAGSVMVGAYQQFGRDGRYVGRGTAEWRYQSAAAPQGTWATAFFDTYGAADPETDQFALVTINPPASDGRVTGFGAFRYAGDQRRRLFNVTGTVSGNEITWTWAGSGLFGDTVWHVRQAGSYLYGTYTNYNSAGNLEARGRAVWHKSSTTSAFTQ